MRLRAALNLKSGPEWRSYGQSGKKPNDIPTNPNRTYAETGWAGMADWLGTDTVATYLREYLSFEKARASVRDLNLKSETEWREYCRSGKRPSYLPASPRTVYANDGWAGWSDWLGTGKRRALSRKPARSCAALV